MNLRFLFTFKGRINRLPFWLFTLFALFLWLALSLLLGSDITHRGRDAKSFIPMLVILWPSLAVQAKRWHDRDKSAWWILINIVPIVGPLWALIENGFFAGTEGENRYGEDPLGRVSKEPLPNVDMSPRKVITESEWKPSKYYLSTFMKGAMIFGIVMLILSSAFSLLLRKSFAVDLPGPIFFAVMNVAFITVIIWRIRTPLIEISEEGVKVGMPVLFKTNFAKWDEIGGMVVEEARTFGCKEGKLKLLLKAAEKAATKEMVISLKAVEKPEEIMERLRAKIPEKGYEDIKQSTILLQKPITQTEIKYREWVLTESGARKGKETIPWERVKEIKYAGLVISGYGATTITYIGGGGRIQKATASPSTTEVYQDFIRYLIQHSQKASIDPSLLKVLEYSPKDASGDSISLLFVIIGIFLSLIAGSFLNYYSPTVTLGNLYPLLIIPFGLFPIIMAVKGMAGRFRGRVESVSKKFLWSSLSLSGPVMALFFFFIASPFSFYWFVGDVFNKTGNPEKAEVYYREALVRFPESMDILYDLGKLYRARKDYANASHYLQQAYTKDPSYWGPAAIVLIPDTLLKMGKHEEALRWCEKILQNHPKKIDIRNAISKKQDEIIREMDFYKRGAGENKAKDL